MQEYSEPAFQKITQTLGLKKMTIYLANAVSDIPCAVCLAVGVASGALPPIGSAARAQALQWATRAGGIGFDEGRRHRDHQARRQLRHRVGSSGHRNLRRWANPTSSSSPHLNGSDISSLPSTIATDALLWATQAGGTGDEGLGIATTERGDSYVTGYFSGTATFGAGEPNETTLTPAGQRRYLRCQVRPRRRASLGHPGRRHRSTDQAAASRPPRAATAT